MTVDNESFVGGLLRDVRLSISERLESPLISTFSVSWCIINYKLIIIILSSEHIFYKLKLINWYFSSSYLFGVLNSFIYPVLITVFYIFVYPLIALRVNNVVLTNKMLLIDQQKSIENKRIVTADELSEIHSIYQQDIDDLNAEIVRLKSINSKQALKLQMNEGVDLQIKSNNSNSFKKQSQQLENEMIDLLVSQENTNNSITVSQFLGSFNKSYESVLVNYVYKKLLDENIIEEDFDPGDGRNYINLTSKGREGYLLNKTNN